MKPAERARVLDGRRVYARAGENARARHIEASRLCRDGAEGSDNDGLTLVQCDGSHCQLCLSAVIVKRRIVRSGGIGRLADREGFALGEGDRSCRQLCLPAAIGKARIVRGGSIGCRANRDGIALSQGHRACRQFSGRAVDANLGILGERIGIAIDDIGALR